VAPKNRTPWSPISGFDTVDGFLPTLQRMLQPLNKEECDGTDQDGWDEWRKLAFYLMMRPGTEDNFAQRLVSPTPSE
jgi:hypothetical protein